MNYDNFIRLIHRWNLKTIKNVVESGTNMHSTKPKGSERRVVLNEAIKSDNKDVFDYLIDKGAIVNYENHRITSPLRLAIKENKIYYVKKLLKCGASIKPWKGNLSTIYGGRQPLLSAVVEYGDYKMLKYVLEYKRDTWIPFKQNQPFVKDINNCNIPYDHRSAEFPLYKAAKEGNIKKAKLLIEYGADVDKELPGIVSQYWLGRKQKGWSALDQAVFSNNYEFAKMLLKDYNAEAYANRLVWLALTKGYCKGYIYNLTDSDCKFIIWLLDNDYNITSDIFRKGRYWYDIIQRAVKKNQKRFVEKILDNYLYAETDGSNLRYTHNRPKNIIKRMYNQWASIPRWYTKSDWECL